VATAVTYPFDIMRTHFAIQGKDKAVPTISEFIRITHAAGGGGGGGRGFYKGLAPALAGVGPYMGLNFAIYEAGMSLISQHYPLRSLSTETGNGMETRGEDHIAIRAGLAGGVSGTLSKLAVYPLDTVKKRMQLQALRDGQDLLIPQSLGLDKTPFYRGMTHCVTNMYRIEGFAALYKGILPTLLKSFVSTAITFAAYEKGKEMLKTHK